MILIDCGAAICKPDRNVINKAKETIDRFMAPPDVSLKNCEQVYRDADIAKSEIPRSLNHPASHKRSFSN
jgi:hypothetical protein